MTPAPTDTVTAVAATCRHCQCPLAPEEHQQRECHARDGDFCELTPHASHKLHGSLGGCCQRCDAHQDGPAAMLPCPEADTPPSPASATAGAAATQRPARRLYHFGTDGLYGEVFVDEAGALVRFIHENDGEFRQEYMSFIGIFFGGSIVELRVTGCEPPAADDDVAGFVTQNVTRIRVAIGAAS